MINLLNLRLKDIPAPESPPGEHSLEWYIGEFVAAAFELRSADAATRKEAKAAVVNEVYHRMGWILADLRREHG